MYKLRLFILLIIAFNIKLNAQNTVHLCEGENHNFGIPFTNGSVYNWQVQNSTIAIITSGNGTEHITLDLNNPGVFQLLVEEVDVNGCNGYDSILVEIHALPNPSILALGPISFCEGDSVLLQLDSNYVSNIWNNGINLTYTYIYSPGNYFATVIDTNGCSNISNYIYVDVNQNPIADYIIDGVCLNSPTTFINNSILQTGNISTLIWYLGNGEVLNGDSVTYTYTNLGSYNTELLVISDLGCRDTISKIFSIFNNPTAEFTFNPKTISTLMPDINFINTSENTFSVLWDFDDSTTSFLENPMHEFENPGIYNVMLTVSDTNFCVDSVVHKITMYYDYVLYIPNSFTPNGDGDNDKFGPVGLRMEKFKSYQFIIYNRWGDQVFITEKFSEKWDGIDAQSGVYNWVVILKDELGEIRKEVGEVILIK